MNIGTMTITIGGTTKRSTNGQHTISVDWENLPDESRAFIVNYGLKQYLADGAAGAADNAALVEGVDARVKKLLVADFSRTRGEGAAKPDTEERIAIKLAKEMLRAVAKAKGATLDKDKLAEAATTFLASDHEKAKAILAEAKRQMKNKPETTEDDDILSALGL